LQYTGNTYDYSLVEYVNCRTKVKIICSIHGVFQQRPDAHCERKGCVKCGQSKRKEKLSKSNEFFIKECNIIHNNKYDYSLTKYINIKTIITVICPTHKKFKIEASAHLHNKRGCQKCNIENEKQKYKDEFIKTSKQFYGTIYEYDKFIYVNWDTPGLIKCIKHNFYFKKTPGNHLINKQGCPKCAIRYSKNEEKIENWLILNKIKFIKQYKFQKCKNKRKLPFDFYLLDYNICIEFDGYHHYNPIHGKKTFKQIKKCDNIKTHFCKNNNIKLIRIPYWESGKIFEILEKELFKNNS
jgi:very-short-patch-repair endonuclease